MVNRVQTLRSSAPGVLPQPGTRQPGELWLNFADFGFGFVDASQTAQKLLAVRWFVTTASYAVGDFVLQGGNLYRAIAPSAAGTFVAANWSKVGTAADLTAMQAYVDAGDAARLPLAGGAMTGPIVLAADPTAALQPATKQYADKMVPLAGGTMTGALILSGPPTQNLQAATKAYVDSGAFLPIGGGTLTGPLVLAADPSQNLGAATKQYVDTGDAGAKSYADGKFLPLAGGTLSGALSVGASSAGYIALSPGDTHTGLLAFYPPGGARAGYIGYGSGNTINWTAEAPLTNISISASLVSLPSGPLIVGNGGVTGLNGANGMSVNPATNGVIINALGYAALSLSRFTNAGTIQQFYYGQSTQVGTISITSSATAYNTTSDTRLKEDERDFDAGPILDRLKVYDFKWTSTGERAHGVMAQEANEVFPQAVHHDEDEDKDAWFVDYSKFVPLLLREVQALRARVSELEAAR